MIKAVYCRTVWLAGLILLVTGGCHVKVSSDPQTMVRRASLEPTVLASGPSLSDDVSAFAARRLIDQLEQDAALYGTTGPPPRPEDQGQPPLPPVVITLPPLPLVSHLSSYIFITDEADRTVERYLIALSPQTPDVPALFTEADDFGHGLGLDMGLTEPDLPSLGAADWPVAVQAYCVCPDEAGLYHTDEGRARLDFGTGRFRLSAGFSDTAHHMRSVGMDIALDQPRLLARQAQPATTELGFANRAPVRLDGELELYLSGRGGHTIAGQFSSSAQMDLSDILFVMQFASGSQ